MHSVFAPPAIRRRVESNELELPGINQTQDCIALWWHKQQPDPGCVHYGTNNSQTLAGASGVAGAAAKNCYKLIVARVFSISIAVRFSLRESQCVEISNLMRGLGRSCENLVGSVIMRRGMNMRTNPLHKRGWQLTCLWQGCRDLASEVVKLNVTLNTHLSRRIEFHTCNAMQFAEPAEGSTITWQVKNEEWRFEE